MGFSRYVEKFERSRAFEFSLRKTAENYDSNYTNKWKHTHQVFLNQQNALGLHAERAGEVLYVHNCAKFVARVIESLFSNKELPFRVSSDKSSEGIRYMDPVSNVFYRSFTITNCNHLYPNTLELQNGLWITYGRQIELIEKPMRFPITELTSIGQVLHQSKDSSMMMTLNIARQPKG